MTKKTHTPETVIPTPRVLIRPPEPILRFTPYAWAKLQFFCHRGETEIGGFGISDPGQLLLVRDFLTVRQAVTGISVAFDDDAVADFMDRQVDAGRRPREFFRIWCHTHPADSPSPSYTDELTFRRVFGPSDWAVMFILAQGGSTYARLGFNAGPGGHVQIPVQVDYRQPFEASNLVAWEAEYQANIQPKVTVPGTPSPLEGCAGQMLHPDEGSAMAGLSWEDLDDAESIPELEEEIEVWY